MNLEKLKDTARKYEQKEDWRRAIDVYLKAIQEFESGKEPHPDLSLYNRVGDLYMKVNDPAAAVRSYERALALDPADPYAAYNLGKLLYLWGRLEDAERHLRSALEHKAGFSEARVVLAGLLEVRGDLTGALAELAAGVLSQQDLGGARHQFAPGKCSFATSSRTVYGTTCIWPGRSSPVRARSMRFVLAPAVPLLEPDYHLAEVEVLQQ